MADLGTTTDPRVLVPGYPDEITATATGLRAYAESLQDAGSGMKRIETTEGWEGEAAERFRAAFDGEPVKWLEAGDCFEGAAEALERYCDTLTWAQQQAREAIVLWNSGEAETNYAKARYAEAREQAPPGGADIVPPFHDPGAVQRQRAREILEQKGAVKNRAWIVFFDESGVSLGPVTFSVLSRVA